MSNDGLSTPLSLNLDSLRTNDSITTPKLNSARSISSQNIANMEVAECTFHPEISPYAKSFTRTEPISERTQSILLERQKKLEKLQKQLEEKFSKFSFKPEIKNYPLQNRRDGFFANIEEQLKWKKDVDDAIEKSRKDDTNSDFKFKPEISSYSKNLERGEEPIHERLFKLSKSLEKEKSQLFDENTGQKLFVPTISPNSMVISSTLKSRNEEKIEERMYKEAAEQKQKREQLVAEKQEEIKAQTYHTSEKSKQFVIAKLEKELQTVFDLVCDKELELMDFQSFAMALHKLSLFKHPQVEKLNEEELNVHESIWKLFDNRHKSLVDFDAFKQVMIPIINPEVLDEQDIPEDLKQALKPIKKDVKALVLNRMSNAKLKNIKNAELHVDKELTFKPEINPISIELDQLSSHENKKEDSEQLAQTQASQSSSTAKQRYEKLLKQQKEREEKIAKEREVVEKTRMKECTFQPKIIKKPVKSTKNDKKPHFVHLYEQANKPKRLPTDYKPAEAKELQKCTFRPDIATTKKYDVKKILESDSAQKPRGFEKIIDRLKKAQHDKEARKEYEENLLQAKNWTGEKTQPKPFEFHLDKRKRTKPLLFMDVNLGPGKTGRIGIHENDNPKQLAKNFAQSYRLDASLTNRLEELLHENMEKNGIPIGEYVPNKPSYNVVHDEQEKQDFNSTTSSVEHKVDISNASPDSSLLSFEKAADEGVSQTQTTQQDQPKPVIFNTEISSTNSPASKLIASLQRLKEFTSSQNLDSSSDLLIVQE